MRSEQSSQRPDKLDIRSDKVAVRPPNNQRLKKALRKFPKMMTQTQKLRRKSISSQTKAYPIFFTRGALAASW